MEEHKHDFTEWENIAGTHLLIRVCQVCFQAEHQVVKPVSPVQVFNMAFWGDE